MIPILTFTGYSDSGKTTLASAVIKELADRGYKVAAIKHDGDGHDYIADKTKDSGRHKEAGAICSIISSSKGLLMDCNLKRDASAEELVSLLPAFTDIVICEGFKSSALPKIEVWRNQAPRANEGDPLLLALATDEVSVFDKDIPLLNINKPAEVADFIEDRLLQNRQEIALHLIVDGRPVPTKDFLLQMLSYSIRGLIKPLKGCSEPKEIIIKAVYE